MTVKGKQLRMEVQLFGFHDSTASQMLSRRSEKSFFVKKKKEAQNICSLLVTKKKIILDSNDISGLIKFFSTLMILMALTKIA